MNELYGTNLLPQKIIDLAIKYINNCYNKAGYFISDSSEENPHIYSTYLALKCLLQYSTVSSKIKNQVKKWILSQKKISGKWGISRDGEETIAHSAYALFILHYCGLEWNVIKKAHKDVIDWIRNNFENYSYTYEEYDIPDNNIDSSGNKYKRLRISHFVLPLVGNLFIEINDKISSLKIVNMLISSQKNGAWGPYNDKLTMWATLQAITFLKKFEELKLKQCSNYDIIYSKKSLSEVGVVMQLEPPIEIQESLIRFKKDYPDSGKVAFIMMKFGNTKAHNKIIKDIKVALEKHNIKGVRADDKQYHDDLLSNVLTYIYGCGFGIAVFERIEADEFNPNVSFEVGYMAALKKPICLLKDKTLKTLNTDLIAKLYKVFNPHDSVTTIPTEITKWLCDKEIILPKENK